MRKMKYVIGVLLLFLIVGFATISISLNISGSANVLSDLDDFKIYFSNVKVNDIQDLTLVKSDKELIFDIDLSTLGTTYTINYDVTNASSIFDAEVSINCTQGDEVLSITNEFDTSNLSAKSTRKGILTLKKVKPNINAYNTLYQITCTITANALPRTEEANGEAAIPAPSYKYAVGNEITIGNEKFNIISNTPTTITLLAKYNLDTNYKQSTTTNRLSFSTNNGWEYSPGPKDIDIQKYEGNAKKYVNEYSSYITTLTGDINLVGNLPTLMDLKKLGCNTEEDYNANGENTCKNSQYKDWLINGQGWWTRSAVSNGIGLDIFNVTSSGEFFISYYNEIDYPGIRPTITISIDALENPTPLIKFYIADTTYYAVEGMTWGDWLDSKYNTTGYYITKKGTEEYIRSEDGYYIRVPDESYALEISNIIQSDAIYLKTSNFLERPTLDIDPTK